jgi:hypothetical protein
MLSHLERGSFLGDALVKDHRRRTPSLLQISTKPEYRPTLLLALTGDSVHAVR